MRIIRLVIVYTLYQNHENFCIKMMKRLNNHLCTHIHTSSSMLIESEIPRDSGPGIRDACSFA